MGIVKSAVYLILALGFATATVLLAGQASGGRGTPRASAPTLHDVVIAGERIGPGEALDGKRLTVSRLPTASTPPDRFARVEDLNGRVASSEILAGDVITDKRLAPSGTAPGIAAMLTPGMRAVAVRLGDLNSVSTMPSVGALVDVLVTLHRGGLGGQPSTRTLLQRVKVLAASPAAGEEARMRPGQARTVTLMVRPDEAEMLALAGAEGVIHLALRSDTDDEDSVSAGANMASLLGLPEKPTPLPIQPRAETPIETPTPTEPTPVDTHRVLIRRGSAVEEVDFERPATGAREPWSRRQEKDSAAAEKHSKPPTETSTNSTTHDPQPNPHAGDRRP